MTQLRFLISCGTKLKKQKRTISPRQGHISLHTHGSGGGGGLYVMASLRYSGGGLDRLWLMKWSVFLRNEGVCSWCLDGHKPSISFQLDFYCVFLSFSCLLPVWLERAISFPALFCVDLRQTTDDSNELWRSLKLTVVSRKRKKKKSVVVGGEKGTVDSLFSFSFCGFKQ